MRIVYYTIATGFGLGYSPVAPGTAGSILGLLIAYFLIRGNTVYLVIASVVCFGAGIISATAVERDSGIEDPSLVVVDEIIGMWISLFFIPYLWWSYLIAFLLFRFFDVVKPFPVNSIQKLQNGWGIMMDDVLAGVYA
ncbi:MAG: phosphatidylglycerophosphatase A, partial [Nitrosopumilaceae archaeon]|nr:phosphatidylglycerophosphatase A [Nitrosopumilaceae archaeon]NIU87774.1 phosphatidylglycerophosphatase A [Nitrosopumilaceae archaeon]NIV66152.1 phosphatidylglycerophosphatase A [Nitrosopumilaceae archaeon]NIX62018.1 phosphatidylglycerophosphatase A [Nitrosopumilaceae archaeon]